MTSTKADPPPSLFITAYCGSSREPCQHPEMSLLASSAVG